MHLRMTIKPLSKTRKIRAANLKDKTTKSKTSLHPIKNQLQQMLKQKYSRQETEGARTSHENLQ